MAWCMIGATLLREPVSIFIQLPVPEHTSVHLESKYDTKII